MKKIPTEFNFIYFTGVLLEILGLALIILSMYLLPYTFLDTYYKVPFFVTRISWWLDAHGYASSNSMYFLAIFVPVFLIGVICLLGSKLLTTKIERETLEENDLSLADQIKTRPSESTYTLLKIMGLAALLFMTIWFVVYFL